MVTRTEIALALLILLAFGIYMSLAPKVMIDVEIYASGDPPELIYCATGALVAPAIYMGSGQIESGRESYC